jgi:peptidylprolyl isomerase
MRRLLLTALALASLAMTGSEGSAADPENTLYMELDYGRVVIEMRPDLAPKHVARIKELVRRGFYDGLAFHRVIDGFMAQGGDPAGNGTGGSGQRIPAEFSHPSVAKHVRGSVSMARSQHPDSADSQFFISFEPAPFLDGKYTIWGQVVAGMEHVDRIKRGEPVRDPDRIITMRVAADVD